MMVVDEVVAACPRNQSSEYHRRTGGRPRHYLDQVPRSIAFAGLDSQRGFRRVHSEIRGDVDLESHRYLLDLVYNRAHDGKLS